MRGNGTKFMVISFKSTFKDPSNLDELVKLRGSLEDSQTKHSDLEKKFDEANNTISQVN